MASINTTRPRSLRRQLVTVLVAVLLVFTGALALTSTWALRSQLVDRLDQQLNEAGARLMAPPPMPRPQDLPDDADTDRVGQPPAVADLDVSDDIRPWFGQDTGTLVVTYEDGKVRLAGYVSMDDGFVPLSSAQIAELEEVTDDGAPHDVMVSGLGEYRALTVQTITGEPVIVALSTSTVHDTLTSFVLVELALVVVGVAVAGLVGAWRVRRSLLPLDAVAAAASRVSELELARGEVGAIERVDAADERTEVGQVGAALNRMLDNVETSLVARHESETQVRQFVADASHELRTPLASIRGYAELVRRSPDIVPPDTLRALDRIESESKRLGSLVEDLLLLARLDAGRPLGRAPVDLAAVAVDAIADAHAASADHVWELDLHAADGDGELPDVVVPGDEARLRQVFANLLGNARIHTPPGTRVVVGLREESSSEDSGSGAIVVTVADDGPGIAPRLRPQLFQRFTRGDTARTRTGGSTGLGLAIAQSIVVAHGGEIAVRSTTVGEVPTGGAGTTFEVRLPRQ